MQPTTIGTTAQPRSIDDATSADTRSLTGTAGFLVLLTLPFIAVAYPLLAVGVFAGGVALAALSRIVAASVRRHRGAVRRITLPGLGTVEYRLTHS